MARTAQMNHRGRNATRPGQIPKAGWRDVLLRVKSEMGKDNLGLVSAGVAFYFLLSIFPAIGAFVSIYGLVYDPADAQNQVQSMSEMMPGDARTLLMDQMRSLTSGSEKALGFGALLGIFLALWSTMKGTTAIMTALNIVYDEEETRGFIKLNLTAFALTVGAVLFFAISLALIAALPPILEGIGVGRWVEAAFSILRWPLLAFLVVMTLAIFYRYAPDRKQPRWRWVNPGSLTAATLWLIGSALFSWYVSNFGSYNETYGSLGAVIVLLMWFYVTAYIVLIGGELNAELEHQTRQDTTEGREEPMGQRQAYVADTVGKKP